LECNLICEICAPDFLSHVIRQSPAREEPHPSLRLIFPEKTGIYKKRSVFKNFRQFAKGASPTFIGMSISRQEVGYKESSGNAFAFPEQRCL